MKDRLQFRHHDAIFNTREDAINYITNDIRYSENGLSKDDVKQLFSLYAEPTVLRYKNADDESNPHIILAIGAKSNQVEGAQYKDNKFCFIDIDKTEDEIEALGDKLEKAITSLAIITRDTNTLSLSVDKNESGETLSGNVKVPATYIINGTVTNNTLKVTENGIFTYVNLNYDKDTDKLTFTVNGDTKEWNVNNDYITGGSYSIKDESLHLGMHSGKDIQIPFEELINEWDVEGENANSPIVLTREKVSYEDDKVVDHRHGNRWQDTLKADVRIANIPHNILNRTEDGKALYVKGTAGNIKFFKDGKEMTVADALVECANKKLSTDNDNMIYERPDGYFAMSRLTYNEKENTLTFTTSNQSGGTTDEKIELNSIKIIDDARYDRDTESLIFIYTTAKGEYKKLVVPVGSLIDEWDVNNDGHNVILKKERKSNVDKDILSADVRVSSLDNNILVEKGDGLYVNGEAKNIKYSDDSSVKDEISAAKESIANEIERAKKAEKEASDAISNVVATIGSGFTTDTHETVTCKVEQLDNAIKSLDNAIKSKVSSVGKIDNSVVVDASDASNPKVGVKLSNDKRDEKIPNLIELHENGLFAAVDLSYDESGNSLTFTTTNGSKTINLAMNSFVDNIYYDSSREVIVIEYTVNGKKMPNVEVPVRTLINEWTVSDNTDGAVKLKKTVNNSGASDNNKDILSAEVIIDKNHGDNMLINDNGALYVSSGIVKEVASKLDKEIERATKKDEGLENKIDEATLGFSSTTSVNVDANDKKNIRLSTKISNSNNNLITIDSVKEGLYVTASVKYDNAANELQLLDANQNVISHTKLGSGSIIESITYDKNGKNLIITYKNNDGDELKVQVPVEDLFNEWTVDNKSEGSALELKKVVAENDTDLLSGKVLLATGETDNMIQIVGNGLYVSSSSIKQNTANIAEIKGRVDTLKTDFDVEKARSTAKDAEQDRNIEVLSGKSASSDAAIDKNTQAISDINTDIAALKQKDIYLSNGLNYEEARATRVEGDLNNAISAETKARKDAESEIKADIKTNRNAIDAASKSIASETNRATSAETALKTSIEGLKHSLDDTNASLTNEVAKITAVTSALTTDLENEVTRSSNEDRRLSESLTTEANRAQSAETSISNSLAAEVTRASNAEDNLNKAISAETKAREDAESEIKADIKANKLQFADSTSVSLLRSDATSPNTVKGSVKISNSNNNLITIDSVKEGLYVTASVKYDNAKNELQLLDANQNVISHTKLGSGSIIESITYDKNGKNLVITYKNSDGAKLEINVPVEDLFNEWTVDNKSEGSALELKKVVAENSTDLLSGKVLLATGETDNMIQIVGNGLYVSSSSIKKNTSDIAEIKGRVDTLKTDFDVEKARSTTKDYEQDRNIEALSGKSASSDVAIDKNTQAISDINTDIAALKQKDIDLSNGLNAEEARVTRVEGDLNKAISAETKARKDAESEIKAYIETNRNAIDAASKSIASETNRATSAETALKTSIEGLKHSLDDTNASLTNEVAKITAVTSALTTDLENEVTRSSNEDRRLSESLTTEANRAQSAETSISNSLAAEVTRVTNIENAIKSDLAKEVSDRKSSDEGFKEDIKKINSGNTAISGAVTSLESKINSEIQRSKDADNSHSEKIKANTDLVNSTKNALDAEVTRAREVESSISNSLTTETNRAQSAETSISNSLAAEVTRASNAEDNLNKAISAETKARVDAEKVIKADIEANKLKFADSTSVSLLRSDATSPNTVKASVKISNAPKNLLSLSDTAEGLFANVSLKYDAATNTLSVIGSDGVSSISDVKLGTGSIVDKITYDSVKKALVIEYTDSTGTKHSTEASVEDLFNEWVPDSDANNVAIELRKQHNVGENDVLTAKVLVSADDDNIVKIKDNKLYVSNAPIVKNATNIDSVKTNVATISGDVNTLTENVTHNLDELRNLEKATLGLISPVGDVKYTPHEDAHLISAATSMNSADVILDNKLFEVGGKVTTVEATLDLNSKELKKVEKVIGVTGNGDNDIAYPNNGHGIIDGATTYADADEKLEKALVDVKALTSGALTPTANLHVDGVDSDKKLQVDVRLSHGKGSTMTDENLTITSTDNPEFSEENALRKVALDNGDVTSTMSGLFLSTTWNCGEYDRDERPESMDIFDRLFDNSKRQ